MVFFRKNRALLGVQALTALFIAANLKN